MRATGSGKVRVALRFTVRFLNTNPETDWERRRHTRPKTRLLLDSVSVVTTRFWLHIADVISNSWTSHRGWIVAVGGRRARGDVPNLNIHHRA